MTDLIIVSIIGAFFALCVLYLRWCDRIIGADDFASARGDMSDSSDTPSATLPTDSTGVTA